MAPNPNIYAALLQGTNLNYSQAMVWEERVKTCHTYAKFGQRYRQRVRFLLAKDKGEFTLFQNSYQREYYMLPQWERIGGDNEPPTLQFLRPTGFRVASLFTSMLMSLGW